MASPTIKSKNKHVLETLVELSGVPSASAVNADWVSSVIHEAPDPETATRVVADKMALRSQALARQWRKVINETWLDQHPNVGGWHNIPLTHEDVANVPAMADIHALLTALHKKSARLEWQEGERLMAANDVNRIVRELPSVKNNTPAHIENEWSCLMLRRMRAMLEEMRLVRQYGGKLVVVESRYDKFKRLPLVQQYYMLWHTDVYHVDWSMFAGPWGLYMRVMQNYIPLMWDIQGDVEEGEYDTMSEFVGMAMEAFRPVWSDEGVLQVDPSRHTLLSLYEQCTLPSIVNQLLVKDILLRYGLIEPVPTDFMMMAGVKEATMTRGQFLWTAVAEALLPAERDDDLPCGVEALR